MTGFLKRERLFLSIFGLSVIIFLWDVILLKSTFLYGDYKQQFFPWYMEYARAVKDLTLPFWTHHMGCGFPLVAEGQVGPFYPLNLILFFIMPPVPAYSYSIVLHFMLGGIFMYIFMRELRLRGISAALPPILFMFASPYAGCFSNIASLKTLCWFPLVLYLIFRSFERNKPFILIFSGIVMGMQLLAGAPQMAFYSIVFSAFYFLFLLITARDKPVKTRIGYVVLFALSGLIALAIWTPQLIATNTLLSLSDRSARGLFFALSRSFFPAGIITLIFPHTTTIFQGAIYIGILPVIFAIAALFDMKNRQIFFFTMLFLVSISCAFGRFNPLYVFFLKLSHLYLFRIPSKFLFFSAFSLIALSGFGLQNIMNGIKEEKLKIINITVFSIFVASLGSIVCFNIFFKVFRMEIVSLLKDYFANHMYSPLLHRHPIQYYMDSISDLYLNLLNGTSFFNKYMSIQLLILTASLFLFIFYCKKIINRKFFQKLCVAVIFIDLIFFSLIGTGFRGNIVNIFDKLKKSDAVTFLKNDNSLFRIYMFNVEETESPLQANLNIYWEIDNIGAYSPLVFGRYHRILADLGCIDDSSGIIAPAKDALYRNLPLLGMLNVKYIITQGDVTDRKLEFLRNIEGGKKLYLNKMALPRAFVVHKLKVISDEDGILAFMKDRNFDPAEEVVMEDAVPQMTESAAYLNGGAQISINNYTDRDIEIRAKANADGMLVLSDYFYPGWKAYLDGKLVRIFRANYIVRAVYLPKGEHEVKFTFSKPI